MRHSWNFFCLTLLSTLFWWSFEFLNQFTANWHYLNPANYSSWEYFYLASLPFATVLPAVWSTAELLSCLGWGESFRSWCRIGFIKDWRFQTTISIMSVVALATCGLAPDILFPCIWIAPFFLLVTMENVCGKKSILSPLVAGDWSRIIQFSLAALVCGFFWEMWNEFSLPKWQYTIPWVGRFQIFEMPILGYGGYLPFGLECAAVGRYVMSMDYLD